LPEKFAAIVRAELRTADLKFSDTIKEQLSRFSDELEHWNRRVNLTSLSGSALVRRLIIEPVWIGEELKMSGMLVDIGSGNGSPAIPLSITREFQHAHLIEARTRRSAFLRHVIATFQIPARVHHGRFEDVCGELPTVDWITLQAVHPTNDLIKAMRQISTATTTALWITSTSIKPAFGTVVKTPFPDTQAILFKPGVM
jgi:16S rRNA (guanine527-N7)-methyltransferase